MINELERFIYKQKDIYDIVLKELTDGEKEECWMWYIFPQLRGLGKSKESTIYGIASVDEAKTYLSHPILGTRLVECCETLLTHKDKSIEDIMGDIDCLKLQSSMTLFALISEENSVFHKVLTQFYNRKTDHLTEAMVSNLII